MEIAQQQTEVYLSKDHGKKEILLQYSIPIPRHLFANA
jgi:hypothetical protein